jgi:hypothetical protein
MISNDLPMVRRLRFEFTIDRVGQRKYNRFKMSPTILLEKGYRFFFFSREEPRTHIHVIGTEGEAKYRLSPEIEWAKNHGFLAAD